MQQLTFGLLQKSSFGRLLMSLPIVTIEQEDMQQYSFHRFLPAWTPARATKLTCLLINIAWSITNISAQNLEISLKGGLVAAPGYWYASNAKFQDTKVDLAVGGAFSLQALIKATPHLYWGVEGARMEYKGDVDTKMVFTNQSNYSIHETGTYRLTQWQLMGKLEFLFGKQKMLFANLGAGLCKDQKSSFIGGVRTELNNGASNEISDLNGVTHQRNNALAATVGAGIRSRINNTLCFIAEIKYHHLFQTHNGTSTLILNYRPIGFAIGLGIQLH